MTSRDMSKYDRNAAVLRGRTVNGNRTHLAKSDR
jgi:hypothetical protein